ncbi:3-mercaptopyruvate sulfurtransferase [Sphingomonas sp. GCM10030256]|uniref:3-mercaptopyruvate sulfurtransferase n=1 Tax=Sphingomonas sp. GCM10030256 TaxID=3273427 RepID=UPI00362042F3
MNDLVTTEWLASELGAPDLTILDASWHMPAANRAARAEYEERHIPGARFFDIDTLSDHDAGSPHMLPPADQFGCAMVHLGVRQSDRVVVYDNSDLRTSARAWFMLRHFGAPQVAILDGGFAKWQEEGRPVESGYPPEREGDFRAEAGGRVVVKTQLLQGMDTPVLDARGKDRFEGSEADPRPGVAAGHIPGARNIPYAAIYNPDGTFRSPEDLREVFRQAGADPDQPFVATCGSGVTANSLIFAAHLLGNDRARLYDGSWAEWGSDAVTPKALGPA